MYTQEQIEAMSDFEINKLVAKKEGIGIHDNQDDDGSGKLLFGDSSDLYSDYYRSVNYCNSWSDMGPITFDNEISISPLYEKNPDTLTYDLKGWVSGSVNSFCDEVLSKNPLRAAAIVYLLME